MYRALLHLYPRAFREEFGDAMIEFFRDRLAGRERAADRALAGWRAMNDVVRNAIPARVDDICVIAMRTWRRHRLAPH